MRTTEVLVKEIVEVDDSISLIPFMSVANSLVTEVCGEAHEEDRLTLIETWLAAHFYTIRDNRLSSESLDFMDYGSKFQFKVGYDLRSSMHGQQVLLLDTSGGFAGLNNQAANGKASTGVVWLGQEDASGL